MRARPVMAAMALTAAAVMTVGGLARDQPQAAPTIDPPASTAPVASTDRPPTASADAPTAPAPASGPTAAAFGPASTASPEPDTPRQLDVEAGMSTEVNALGTRHTSAGAVLTNPHPEAAYGVEVVFDLRDADGGVLDSARETVNYLPGHGSRIVAPLQIGFGLPRAGTSVEVRTTVDEFAADAGPSGGEDAVRRRRHRRPEGARLEVVRSGLDTASYANRVTGQAVNLTAEPALYPSLHCVLRADDAIVGGTATGLSAPIAPGATLTFESLLPFAPEGVDQVDCEVHASPPLAN